MIRSVAVIVPAHDEQRLLPSCLAALRRAARALDGTPVHLFVVADSCRDQTSQVARRGGAAVVTISARCVGTARAEGVREALRQAGPLDPAEIWLATTDADTLVPPDWLRRQAACASRGWDAVAGTVRVADWNARPPAVRALFNRRYHSAAGLHRHVHGANLGFRASAYLRAGGFPDVPTGEDHALVAALTAAGSRVRYTRAITVTTSGRRDARAPHGFGSYLAQLDNEADATPA
jgi:cellulose synthase/poly-beta-1,6-N-acetylglucosamine synthase-like glycosyltransferase